MEAAPELALHGMVIINTVIPEDALSAGLLGTNRAGHGVVIREDGLILTIGYLVSDAESVWITTRSGSTVPGYAVAYDHESGLGLVRATMPLSAAVLDLDDALEARIGDRAYIADSGPEGELHPTRIIARHEFAGRWEYVIDDAIFAAPSHQSWAGAALLNPQGRVMGIGSLLVQTQHEGESGTSANMFVPVHLIKSHIDEICELGSRASPARPWLGVLVQDDEDQLVVVGVYRDCPADRAGIVPGDVIIRVGNRPVRGLATLFRHIWHQGPAGANVPLTVLRDDRAQEIIIASTDRNLFHGPVTVN